MSDSEDDFVEVRGYQSSDSEWEQISGYSSEEVQEEIVIEKEKEGNGTRKSEWPQELVASYYQSNTKHADREIGIAPSGITVTTTHQDLPTYNTKKQEAKRERKGKERKRHWDKVTLKRGHGAPYDPVEFLGITGAEKTLLAHFSIITIGQLAYFNAMDFASSTQPEKFGVILDLQERAYQAVTEYVTKTSSQPDTVWGYLYLGDKALRQILKRGYLDSESLNFLWSPMPSIAYRDQVAIDDLVGMETKNRELRTRYSRFVKINLSKLSNKYYGRLYQRDPNNQTTGDRWTNINLLEAAELAMREDIWYSFEPGNDIYERICHGSIVIPTGRIPQDCLELDKETCAFAKNESSESSDDEPEEPYNPSFAKLDLYY